MFVFWKMSIALFSWNNRFEIHPFALLPMIYERMWAQETHWVLKNQQIRMSVIYMYILNTTGWVLHMYILNTTNLPGYSITTMVWWRMRNEAFGHTRVDTFVSCIYGGMYMCVCVCVYIYVIMKTMCPPGYHHNSFVATHALGHIVGHIGHNRTSCTYVNLVQKIKIVSLKLKFSTLVPFS